MIQSRGRGGRAGQEDGVRVGRKLGSQGDPASLLYPSAVRSRLMGQNPLPSGNAASGCEGTDSHQPPRDAPHDVE